MREKEREKEQKLKKLESEERADNEANKQDNDKPEVNRKTMLN